MATTEARPTTAAELRGRLADLKTQQVEHDARHAELAFGGHPHELADWRVRKVDLERQIEDTVAAIQGADRFEAAEKAQDAERRLTEARRIHDGLGEKRARAISIARTERTAEAVDRAVEAWRSEAGLRAKLWEKTKDREFEPTSTPNIKALLGDLARLSTVFRNPHVARPPVDDSAFCHLRLQELPNVD
jgi:hypothetical protein